MHRREFVFGALGAAQAQSVMLGQQSRDKILGMYVHEHWPYKHPYAARTWTLEDWRGYAEALQALGFNTVLVWPVIDTMPAPLMPSDRASLEKHGAVLRMLKLDLGMRALVTVCPNVAAIDEAAAKASFEERHFFYCDRRVNPADRVATRQMMETRRALLEPLKEMDGLAVIDSDPGGYPGSSNAEFVALLGEYRKMLDLLRPGIELLYWMHAGWAAYSRYYETAAFAPGTPAEYADTLERLKKLNPAPWGIATARASFAEKAGLGDRVIALNYGSIENEPSFPLTNFGGRRAYEGGRSAAARGVLGNAQTHCLQLPNTFAFSRGALDKPVERADYVGFAERLLPGKGETVVRGWDALGAAAGAMREQASALEPLLHNHLAGGDLKGLLFGSPHRFVQDLVLQLRFRAAAQDFFTAAEKGQGVRRALGAFLENAAVWQAQHGYENRWRWPELQKAAASLKSREIDEVWQPAIPLSGFQKVQQQYYATETMTPRLLSAMRKTWSAMKD